MTQDIPSSATSANAFVYKLTCQRAKNPFYFDTSTHISEDNRFLGVVVFKSSVSGWCKKKLGYKTRNMGGRGSRPNWWDLKLGGASKQGGSGGGSRRHLTVSQGGASHWLFEINLEI